MALPSGMHLVSALDDANFSLLSPIGGAKGSATTENAQRALLLPLACDETLDTDMDIDVDVFRPSAMLVPQLSDVFDESGNLFFGLSFQPELVDAEEDIEQMLLYGSEDALTLQIQHQHQTAPGQGCLCRNFAIRASHVQAHQEGVAAESMATKDQKRVLRHTFGSRKRVLSFGFGDGAVLNPTLKRDVNRVDGHDTPRIRPGLKGVKQEVLEVEKPVLPVKKEVIPSTLECMSRMLVGNQAFGSPVSSQPLPAISSPSSTTSFVSLESMMATPLSTTSRCTAQSEMPVMTRSLSPADELEKMATSGSKTSMAKMNMLTENFQVSHGHEVVPPVKPTAVLPPPYLRGASDSPEKRRAHSTTFNSFAQSLSFSFSNTSTNR